MNCLVTKDGKAVSRMGYQLEFSIGVTGSPATCFYHKTYDIAFFALGTKLFYRDFAGGATYDTGSGPHDWNGYSIRRIQRGYLSHQYDRWTPANCLRAGEWSDLGWSKLYHG